MQACQVQNPARRHGDLRRSLRDPEALLPPEHRLPASVAPQILLLSSPENDVVMFDPIVRHFVPARLAEVRYHVLCDFQIFALPYWLLVSGTARLVGWHEMLHLQVPVGLQQVGRCSIEQTDWMGLHGWRGPSHGVDASTERLMGLVGLTEPRELLSSWT